MQLLYGTIYSQSYFFISPTRLTGTDRIASTIYVERCFISLLTELYDAMIMMNADSSQTQAVGPELVEVTLSGSLEQVRACQRAIEAANSVVLMRDWPTKLVLKGMLNCDHFKGGGGFLFLPMTKTFWN